MVGLNSGVTTEAFWVDTAAADSAVCIDVLSWHRYNGHAFETVACVGKEGP